MDLVPVKQEMIENLRSSYPRNPGPGASGPAPVIDLSSSDSDYCDSSDSSDSDGDVVTGSRKRSRVSTEGAAFKKKKLKDLSVVLPVGFLDPLPPKEVVPMASRNQLAPSVNGIASENMVAGGRNSKQFWKAGDYEGAPSSDWDAITGGMDRVRVHPKFLHSNATSHKWVLGAFAELLDNSLDEVCNGATYVNIDMIRNKKDESPMLLIDDNGGGMDPDKIRQCMSLGYSVKSKIVNTIGQYGNGFKTSTMRLGADVIVFSRCAGQDGKRPTQSIGLLSYTFLQSTGKEDIVVPMLDYERVEDEWKKMMRCSVADWNRNVETIIQWSPFSSEADLLCQFYQMTDRGTRIIVYNLWEDEEGMLELDFDVDPHDIQIRGVNRDEKKISMAKQFPNSRHFLTYRHSLRSYASILYLRIPPGFRIILRGKDVEHHNIVNDMMMTEEITYRPQSAADSVLKDSNMVAVVTVGFVKDAKYHIDVQGFNVYHKNRLIKPFWRLWNAAGSSGRGVIGVLEANFVEPAHDKQGFERTTVLSRLESRLVQMQKTYWSSKCHKIGYASMGGKKVIDDGEGSPEYSPQAPSRSKMKSNASSKRTHTSGLDKSYSEKIGKSDGKGEHRTHGYSLPSSPSAEYVSDDDVQIAVSHGKANGSSHKDLFAEALQSQEGNFSGSEDTRSNLHYHALEQLRKENIELKESLKRKEEVIFGDLLRDLQYERDKCKSLESQLQESAKKIEDLNKEQETLIDVFSEERERRDIEEENLRKKLKDASSTIQELLDKVRQLEKMKSPCTKVEC